MYRTHTGRPALRRTALAGSSVLFALGALVISLPSAGAGAASAVTHAAAASGVTVRVEGPHSTLVPATTVRLAPATITKDGVAADSCSGRSAAGALELATHGHWAGTWSKSLKGYFISAIDGVSFPTSGAEYWAFWIDDAPASAGICTIDPKAGQSILLFPDCFGKKCPKNNGVLAIAAPAVAHAGKPVSVMVTVHADSNGKASPASGATVSGGGASATTSADGSARLTFTKTGRVTLRVRARHTVRTEASMCVEGAGASGCG